MFWEPSDAYKLSLNSLLGHKEGTVGHSLSFLTPLLKAKFIWYVFSFFRNTYPRKMFKRSKQIISCHSNYHMVYMLIILGKRALVGKRSLFFFFFLIHFTLCSLPPPSQPLPQSFLPSPLSSSEQVGFPWVLPPWHIKSLWGQAHSLPLRPDKATQLKDHTPQASNSFLDIPLLQLFRTHKDQAAHLLHICREA